MKKIIIAFFAVAACAPAWSQRGLTVDERVRLENVDVFQQGDSLFVNFDVVADGRALHRKEGVVITPRVRDTKLPAIIVNGTHRAKMYRREVALAGRRLDPKPGFMMAVRRGAAASGHYSTALKLDPEMIGSRLVLESYVTRCCSEENGRVRNIIAEPLAEHGGVSVADVAGMVTWLVPEEETVKRRETSLTAHINYPQGVSRVIGDFGDNAAELERIDRALSPIFKGNLYSVGNVRIEGFASVEGHWDTNEKLARDRAEGFRKWLTERYGRIGMVSVETRGEDWNGLLEMILADGAMPYQQQAAAIIRDYGIFDGREKRLMDLGQGVPYKYMYRYFFPKLRRMVITFGYEVGALDGAHAAEVMRSRPGDLSHAEMMRTMKAQGGEAAEMYRALAGHYPDDAVALINASSAEMVAGNTAAAWKYLQRVQDDPRAVNNIKVYRLLTSDKGAGPYRYKIATE